MRTLEKYIIGFLFGAALVAIPLLWQQEERELFKFSAEQQAEFCRKVSGR